MAVAGDIKVVMTLDDKEFTYKVQNSGKLIRELSSEISKTASASQSLDKHFTGLGGTFRSGIQTLGMLRFAMYDLRDAFQGTLGFVIKTSGEIERMTKLMQGLSTEADKQAKILDANKNRDFVFNMAQNAPFDVKTLTDSFVKLKSAGLDPTNGSMQTLVDSVARFGGSSDILHRASIAIQQMMGKGVISMEELRQQLGEAVPDAMKAMAVGVGMSMAELNSHIKKGEVESKSALTRMLAVLREWNTNAAAEMMDTWVGQFEKLKTQFTLFGNDIGNSGFFEEMKKQLAELNAWFKTDEARQFAQRIGAALTDVVQGFSTFISFVREYGKEIETFGKILITYFAAKTLYQGFSGIVSAIGSLTASFKSHVVSVVAQEKIRYETLMASKMAEVNQRIKLDNAALMSEQMNQSKAAVGIQAAYAAKMAESEKFYARAVAAENIFQTGMTAKGVATSEAERLRQGKIADAYMKRAAAAEMMAVKISQSEVVVRNQLAATNAAIVAQAEAAAAGAAATAGVIARTGGLLAGAGRGLIGLLGGPIGAITTLLTFGAMAWMEWGNKSQEAIDKANAAIKSGTGTITDYLTKHTQLISKKEQIADLEEIIRHQEQLRKTDPIGAFSSAQLQQAKDKLAQLKAESETIRNDMLKAGNQAEKNIISSDADNFKSIIEAQFNSIEKNANDKETLLKKQFNDGVLSYQDMSTKLRDAAVERYSGEAKIVEANLAKIDKLMSTASEKDKVYYAGRKAMLEKMNGELQEKLANAKLIGTSFESVKDPNTNVSGLGKISKDENKTPLQKYVDSVNEDIAKLQEAGDKAKGELERFEEKVRQGDFNYKVKVGKNTWVSKIATEEELANARERLKAKLALAESNQESERILSKSVSARTQLDNLTTNAVQQSLAADEKLSANTAMAVTRRMTTLRAQLETIKKALQDAASQAGPDADKAREALSKFGDTAKEILAAQARAESSDFILKMRQDSKKFEQEAVVNHRDRMEQEFADGIRIKYEELQAQLELNKDNKLAQVELWEEYYSWAEKAAKAHSEKMKSPLEKLSDEWRDTTKQMQDATAKWATDATEVFVEFVKTGKLNFSSLIDSILTDIIRMQTKKMFANVFNPIFDSIGNSISAMFADGGVMTPNGAVELRKYASGGVATGPQLALYGEGSMNEAYVPLPDGRSIPVNLKGGGQGGGVIVNVYEAPGTKGSVNKTQNADGSFSIDIVIEQIEGKMARNIAQGRGSVASTMERTYGLSRQAGSVR